MKAQIYNIGYRELAKFFTFKEASELLPLIRQITHDTYVTIDPLRRELRELSIAEDISDDLAEQYKAGVQQWIEKMNRLGVMPVTLGMVNFDTGDGYLNWKYPEVSLSYYYDYDADYTQRRPLEKVASQHAPDWLG